DENLNIGDSAILQIHLQGVTSVQASDFIYDPAATTVAAAIDAIDPALAAIAAGDVVVPTASATDIPPDRTVSEDTRWTLPADDESFSFLSTRDGIESIGHARFASLGVMEERDRDADVALAIGSSIEPHHGHTTEPAEDHVASNHA